jgi:hypothetical protein
MVSLHNGILQRIKICFALPVLGGVVFADLLSCACNTSYSRALHLPNAVSPAVPC